MHFNSFGAAEGQAGFAATMKQGIRTVGMFGLILIQLVLLGTSAQAQDERQDTPVLVTVDNFVRAESDRYFRQRESIGGFGRFAHNRDPVDIDHQPVVRANRDTLYSYAVFDLNHPVTITLPEQDDRYQSIRIINQDHYVVDDSAKPGVYKLTKDKVGTRYVHVNVRTLVNPLDPEDVKAARALQDQVKLEQADPGSLDLPNWDEKSRAAVRKAILGLAPHVPDSRRMFGTKDQVDPVRHLIGTAGAWGFGSEESAIAMNVFPEKNDGNTPYTLTVKDVPVDGFWSISVYNSDGYFEKNPNGGYSLNNLTAKKGADGSYTIHFGGDPSQPNWLNISKGWNYVVRMYLPHQEVIDGTWTFPEAEPVK
ncbi:DUF1214 domain-containing protein [Microbulbifer litoralis]|uniref:DUF1214 domain-containing protein n=1 Tax=Microbulbifer litoralis TaxID=2933965 RepID=UPI0020283517|nr:DUF1214 domain-containing protein [Microbulbifer sp. GX H0434]